MLKKDWDHRRPRFISHTLQLPKRTPNSRSMRRPISPSNHSSVGNPLAITPDTSWLLNRFLS